MWKGDLQSFPSPPRMPRILHDVPMRHLPKVSDALWAGCFWGFALDAIVKMNSS